MLRPALMLTAAAFGATLAATAAPTAAAAQAVVEVYGNDPCPRETADNAVVCYRKPERDRFRIPEKLRPSGTPQQRESWSAKAGEVISLGATGPQSCSAVGPGGYTGCMAKDIRAAEKARKEAEAEANPY